MDDEKKVMRKVKVVGEEATHRVGERRAAVKPHKVSTTPKISQIISEYLSGLRTGGFSQTYTGETLAKNAALIRKGFGLPASEELYLLTDPTGTGKAGMLLGSSGAHFADGRGSTSLMSWGDFAKAQLALQRGMLVVGNTGLMTSDAQSVLSLLKHLQSKLV